MTLAVALALAGCGTSSGFGLANLAGMERSGGPSHFGAYLAGQQAQYDGDTEVAARQFRRALQIGPTDPDILERAYVLDISNGDVAKAVPLAARAVELEPENGFARLVVAADHLRQGRFAAAREVLPSSDAGVLTTLTTSLMHAWSFAGEGNHDEGLELLATRDLEGLELFVSYHSALLADLGGNASHAELEYVAAISGSGGTSARVVEAYGNFLQRVDRNDAAIGIYDAYLGVAPQNAAILSAREQAESGRTPHRLVPDARAGAAEALFSVASVVSGQGAYDVPSLYLQLALYLDPDLQQARNLLAEIYGRMELYEQAERIYAAIPPSSPLKFDAEVQRAFMLTRLERDDDAIALLRRLTRTDPNSFQAWTSYADQLRGQARFAEAVDAYAQAIGLLNTEQQSDPRFWALYYSYGIALERTGQWADSENALQYALELNEDQPYVLNYLGYSWIERGENLEEALDMIHRAVEQQPQDGFIVDSLGWGYYQLGQYEEAVLYLERAVELESGDAVLNDHLGDAYWRAGKYRQARFQWNHALDADPEDDQIPLIEDKLQNGLPALPATDVMAETDGGV